MEMPFKALVEKKIRCFRYLPYGPLVGNSVTALL